MTAVAIDYHDFAAITNGRARRERTPVTALFELTPACNLRCKFCYVAIEPYKGPYLGTAQVIQVLDTLQRAGVLWLSLTGGEIFSRRDFPEIYRAAVARGFLITLFSNATMATAEHAALLSELPPFGVEVSIYGADAEHYEGTTGIPGSFARFERGIRLLRDAGVELLLKTPLSTLTADHFEALDAYAANLGVQFKYDMSIDPRLSGNDQPTIYRIEPRQIPVLADAIHRHRTGKPRVKGPLPECEVTDPDGADFSKELYYCGAGRVGLFIDALGQASHCVIDREPNYPILEMPWEDLWARMGAWVTQPLPPEAPCSGCGLRSGCQNCPARSRLATGSSYLKDTYHCDVTHVLNDLEPAMHPDYRSMGRELAGCVR